MKSYLSFQWIESYSKIVVSALFAALFVIGVSTYKDFGISYDEGPQHLIGTMAYNYVFEDNDDFLTFIDRDYGVVFELPLIVIEKVLGMEDTKTIFQMRHLMNFLLFYVALFFFYLIGLHHFKSHTMGLAGTLLLVLSPRIFFHSFYNSKDLPFLSMLIIAMYTFSKFIEKKNISSLLMHVVVSALLINLRIIGIMIFVYTLLYIAGHFLKSIRSKSEIVRSLKLAIIYTAGYAFLTIAFWPYLWTDTLNNFVAVFKSMSKFEYQIPILFFGEMIQAKNLPWYYLPVYLTITTPVMYTLLFIAGFLFCVIRVIRRPLQFITEELDKGIFVFYLCFFGPVIIVIALNSTLYGDWRHLYFVYPPFLFIALIGLNSILELIQNKLSPLMAPKATKSFLAFMAIYLLIVATSMVRIHPYGYLYFNSLIKKDPEYIRHNFEQDYWGISFMDAMHYILEHDKSKTLTLMSENPGLDMNMNILTTEEKKRIKIVQNLNEANYFLGNYRFKKEDYFLNIMPYHAIKVQNSTTMVVYKKD